MDFSAWNNLIGITLGDSWHHNSGTPQTKWGEDEEIPPTKISDTVITIILFLGTPTF